MAKGQASQLRGEAWTPLADMAVDFALGGRPERDHELLGSPSVARRRMWQDDHGLELSLSAHRLLLPDSAAIVCLHSLFILDRERVANAFHWSVYLHRQAATLLSLAEVETERNDDPADEERKDFFRQVCAAMRPTEDWREFIMTIAEINAYPELLPEPVTPSPRKLYLIKGGKQ